MADVTVRRLATDEMLEVMYPITSYALEPSPPFPAREAWMDMLRAREAVTYLALFENGRAVSTVASSAMTQNVRGGLYASGGVWAVATQPSARRKGYSRRLIGALLEARRQEGQVFSCLYPFRESFYERMGYTTFPLPRWTRFASAALAPLLGKEIGGEIELWLIGEGIEQYRAFLRRYRDRVHGMALFDRPVLPPNRRDAFWLALAQVDGSPAGLMLYTLAGDGPTAFTLKAERFYSHGSQGRYLLLQWIARHIDQVGRVELLLPPFEQPETWLSDLVVSTESYERAPMSRVVDLAGLNGLRTGAGHFFARVRDPLCPWNEGDWEFDAREGHLQVRPARRADLGLAIQGLSALVFGTHDPADFAVRGWGDPSPEQQVGLRTVFPPLSPYLHEYF